MLKMILMKKGLCWLSQLMEKWTKTIARNKTQIIFTSTHTIPSLLGKSGISGLCLFTLLAGNLQLTKLAPAHDCRKQNEVALKQHDLFWKGKDRAQMLVFLPHRQHHGSESEEQNIWKESLIEIHITLLRETKGTMRKTECWHPNLSNKTICLFCYPKKVLGPFWGTASIEERAGLDFHL